MKTFLIACTALCCLLSTTTTFAQTATPGINQRQRTEQARIRQGVRSGELNRAEAARLQAREADIRQDRRLAKADGVVTPGERHEIRQDERQAGRAIYRQKHDRQTRHVR